MPARHVCAVIGSAIVNTLIGHCNISIRRSVIRHLAMAVC
jgi:hypothetical protein